MEEIEIDDLSASQLEDPVLLEGLPGVGLVGKVAVDHLVAQLDAEPVRRVYSEHFPPAVSVESDGTASLAAMTLSAVQTEGRDFLVLTGDTQAQEAIGQYRVASTMLDLAEEFGVREVVTLGGFGTGEPVEDYAVVGAVAEDSESLRTVLADAGVDFDRGDALDTIVGMSGLLVGLGGRRGLPTAGLLGTTAGYHVDPGSARAVLEVLQPAFGFSIDLDNLDDQAEEMQEAIERLQTAQQPQESGAEGADLRYFE